MIRSQALAVAVLIMIVLCTTTWLRTSIYENERTLWRDAMIKSPAKARTYNNLGDALKKNGELKESQQLFERAIELDPDYPDALNNLATIYCNIGRANEALELLHKALFLNPGHIPSKYNLAMQYYQMGLLDDAILEYRSIIMQFPLSEQAVFSEAMLQLIRKQRKAQ